MRGDRFLAVRAEEIANRIMNEGEGQRGGKNLPMEIGKGRNYLSKIVKDFESKREEETKMMGAIREKLKSEEVL
jgi:cytochrome c553